MNTVRKILVTGLGTGYLWPAPGSWGSLGPAVIWLAIAWATAGSIVAVNLAMVLLAVFFSITTVLLGPFAQLHFGRKDPGQNTGDEWAGQAITLFLLPMSRPGADGDIYSWITVAFTAFFVFRLFDSIKPFPLRRLEKLPFGWGVLLDDVGAGIYANITVQLVLRYWLLA